MNPYDNKRNNTIEKRKGRNYKTANTCQFNGDNEPNGRVNILNQWHEEESIESVTTKRIRRDNDEEQ